MNTLVQYLLIVLAAIAPHVKEPRRVSIARDIAAVTLSTDRVTFNDDDGRKTALLVVSLGHFETGGSWARWIDDGRCNDLAWREGHAEWLHHGDCDDGHAWGMWQVHAPGDDRVIGLGYVRDRKNGIRAALHTARRSLLAGQRLCWYTGERPPKCPMGDRRLQQAIAWETRFPFPGGAVEVAGR